MPIFLEISGMSFRVFTPSGKDFVTNFGNTVTPIFSFTIYTADEFSIDLTEIVGKDADGNDIVKTDGETATYTNILPGTVLTKKPVVTNTGSYDQYVRVKVTIDNATWWLSQNFELVSILNGLDSTVWTLNDAETVGPTANSDTITYVFYLNNKLTPDATATLFESVTIPTVLTQADMAGLVAGTFSMDILAEAVQTENVGTTAIEAFDTVIDNAQP